MRKNPKRAMHTQSCTHNHAHVDKIRWLIPDLLLTLIRDLFVHALNTKDPSFWLNALGTSVNWITQRISVFALNFWRSDKTPILKLDFARKFRY